MNEQKILDVIEQLIAALPLDPAKAGEILGAKIVRNPAADTAAIEAYAQSPGAKGGAYETIDMRMPDPDIGDGGSFLSVTLRPDNGVDQAAISARFGLEFYADVPSPRYKPGSVPVYLVFEKEWGKLSFGVTSDEDRKLVRFIIAANAPEG